MKIVSKAAFDIQDVSKLVPHGDRLLVEEIEVEDAAYIKGGDGRDIKLVLSREPMRRNPRDPRPEPGTEELVEIARGWKLGRVVAVGSGHRMEIDVTVPMPFEVGDYVFFERMTGRELDFRGVKYRIINQVDVLLHAPEIKALIGLPEMVAAK